MRGTTDSNAGLIFSGLLLAALAVGAFLLLSSDGFVEQWTSLDFSHLLSWIVTGAILMLLSKVAGLAQVAVEKRAILAATDTDKAGEPDTEAEAADAEVEGVGAADTGPNSLVQTMAVARGVLSAAGGAVLISGLLTAIASLPSTISARPGAPDPDTLSRYLQVFGSLIKWVFLAAGFYAVTRIVGTIWPMAGDTLRFPWRQAISLAVAYILLADGGLLRMAFEFPGTLILVILALALLLPYLSSVGRRFVAMPLPKRVMVSARGLLLISDMGGMVLVLGIMVSLPGIVDGIPELQTGGNLESVAPYLEILDSLAFWSIILLAPFIVIRIVAAFRPVVGDVFGFPMGRILLFALALIGFSDNGVPVTASSFPIPQLMPAIGVALLVSYLTLVLRRVGQLGLSPRIAVPLTNIPPLIGAFMPPLSVSLVVWALLQSFPLISAPLLDYSATEAFGKNSLPYFAGLFDARYTMTAFVFTAMLFLSLPDPLWAPARLRVRPMVAAVGFTASGCLVWLSLAPLSGVGHAFPLAGAIFGAGLITLGLCQLAAYLEGSPEPLYSSPTRWLTTSKARGFLIGASLAFYGMLLRPAMYETLWFASVYEWVVVLAVAMWAMFRIRGSMKTFVETAEAAPSNWVGWERHEQQFEDRPDPRRNLVSRWQQRFVESGEWGSPWSYLMVLLCRNNATPEDVKDVFQPLRQSVVGPVRRGFRRGGRDGDQRRREAGLARCLRGAERALTSAPSLQSATEASGLRQAAEPFIESGANCEAVAAEVISEYRRRGADTNHAVNLWFPLVNVVDRPSGRFQFPWVRRRNSARARERRRKLVEGAISHLSGKGTMSSLPVGIAALRAPLSPISLQTGLAAPPQGSQPATSGVGVESATPEGTPPTIAPRLSPFERHQLMRASSRVPAASVSGVATSLAIVPGQGFELLQETDHSYFVRTSENVEGYVSKSALRRLPILPGDEVDVF